MNEDFISITFSFDDFHRQIELLNPPERDKLIMKSRVVDDYLQMLLENSTMMMIHLLFVQYHKL